MCHHLRDAYPCEEIRGGAAKNGGIMTAETLLKPGEVAERLHLSEYTVRDYLRRGLMRGLKPGGGPRGHWFVRESELDRFLQQAEVTLPRDKDEDRRAYRNAASA